MDGYRFWSWVWLGSEAGWPGLEFDYLEFYQEEWGVASFEEGEFM